MIHGRSELTETVHLCLSLALLMHNDRLSSEIKSEKFDSILTPEIYFGLCKTVNPIFLGILPIRYLDWMKFNLGEVYSFSKHREWVMNNALSESLTDN